MPLAWYSLAAGPAPWAAENSYSSSSSAGEFGSPGSRAFSFSVKGQYAESVSTNFNSNSSQGDSTGGASSESSTTSSQSNENYRTDITSITAALSTINRESSGSYTFFRRRTFGGSETITASSSNNYSFVLIESYDGSVIHVSIASTSARTDVAGTTIAGSGISGGPVTSTSFSSGTPTSFTGSTTSTRSAPTASALISTATTTAAGSPKITTSSTVTRTITVGTTGSATTTATQSYTTPTTTLGTSTTATTGVSTTYLAAAYHLIPIIEALPSEQLNLVTATADSFTGLTGLIASAVTRLTLSGIPPYSGEQSVALGTSAAPNTITGTSYGGSTITITASTATNITVTQQSFAGLIPPAFSHTRTIVLAGKSTATRTIVTQSSSETTATVNAWLSYISRLSVRLTETVAETITGLNATGGTQTYPVITTSARAYWTTAQRWSGGSLGASVTARTFGYPGTGWVAGPSGGVAGSQVRRASGFQAPYDLGSTGGQGLSLTANAPIFIGAANSAHGGASALVAPVLGRIAAGGRVSTAATSDSFFSFSAGTASSITVTSALSATSSTGTVTASYFTNVSTYTVGISTVGGGDMFRSVAGSIGAPAGLTIIGGAHGRSGGSFAISANSAYGLRYTLRDSSSSTTSSTLHSGYLTSQLGAQIIALESFSAGLPQAALAGGPPANYLVRPYNLP